VDADDPLRPYRQIEHELEQHCCELSTKPRVIALNKIDLLEDASKLDALVAACRQLNHPVVAISAIRREGLQDLLRLLVQMLSRPSEEHPENSA
jgi:GTPase